MNFGRVAKSNQEQAIASWVNYLNQVRLDRLMEALRCQDKNWDQVVNTLKDRQANNKLNYCYLLIIKMNALKYPILLIEGFQLNK